jgi:hypothetical protein
MKRYFYSSESAHGSKESYGFANDITVLVWRSKADRDRYLSKTDNISAKVVRYDQVTREAMKLDLTGIQLIKPRPYCHEFWAILLTNRTEPGLAGEIGIGGYDDTTERFYR